VAQNVLIDNKPAVTLYDNIGNSLASIIVYYQFTTYKQSTIVCYRSEKNTSELSQLSAQVSRGLGVNFTATSAFIVTWPYMATNSSNSLVSAQCILITNGLASFLIYNFERLDSSGGGGVTYYYDTYGVGASHNVPSVSVNGSNVNASGQYIYQVYREFNVVNLIKI
jgi:hypothetical protein